MPRFEVERSIEIAADPHRIYETVADFNTWTTWSPWLCAEPAAKVTIADNANSVGSIYAWQGEVVGQGEVEHKRLEPGRLIDEELRIVKPWKSTSSTRFRLEPCANGSRVTWLMQGSLPWILFWMRSQMEVLIGMDYDRGLKMLKELIETGRIASRTDVKGVVRIGPVHVAGVRSRCRLQDIGPSLEKSFAEAKDKLPAAGLSTEGEMIAVYHDFRLKDQIFDYTAGYILPGPATARDDLSTWSMPAGNAFRVDHIGNYDQLGNAWSAANQHVRYKKLRQAKIGTFEIYKNDPRQLPPEEWLTEIYLPLK